MKLYFLTFCEIRKTIVSDFLKKVYLKKVLIKTSI